MNDAATVPSGHKRTALRVALTVLWKTAAMIPIILLSIYAANTAGWSVGGTMLGPKQYSTGLGGWFNDVVGGLGIIGSVGIYYVTHRYIAKWAAYILVPIMLYSALIMGVWDGVAGDFDTTRIACLKHHYANAYALRHMRPDAAALSCRDSRITLDDDAKQWCAVSAK